jgi:hypothetical protein
MRESVSQRLPSCGMIVRKYDDSAALVKATTGMGLRK